MFDVNSANFRASLPYMMSIFISPFLGRAVDHFGRRPYLAIFGTLCTIPTFLLMATQHCPASDLGYADDGASRKTCQGHGFDPLPLMLLLPRSPRSRSLWLRWPRRQRRTGRSATCPG